MKRILPLVIFLAVPILLNADSFTYQEVTVGVSPNRDTRALGISSSNTVLAVSYVDPTYSYYLWNGINNQATYVDVPFFHGADGGISANGAITGSAAFMGFILNSTGLAYFSAPGAIETRPYGINDSGSVVGEYFSSEFSGNSFLRSPSGAFSVINFPNSLVTSAYGINNAGDIVGEYRASEIPIFNGFLLHNGSYSEILFPGASQTAAIGINNQGDIVGYYIDAATQNIHGFAFINGVYETVDYPGGLDTQVIGINDNDRVVGVYLEAGSGLHGFEAIPTSVPEPRTLSMLACSIPFIFAMLVNQSRMRGNIGC